MTARRLYIAESNREVHRLGAAALMRRRADDPLVVLGASRGAADDFLRRHGGAGLMGVHALTLTQLAAQCAATALARFGLAPVGPLSLQAVAARVVFQLRAAAKLGYFTPVADTPGFVRGAARTIAELRLEEVAPDELKAVGAPGEALAEILRTFNQQLIEANLADYATLFGVAPGGTSGLLGLPLLALDAPLRSKRAREFAKLAVERAASATVVVLAGDAESLQAWRECLGVEPEIAADGAGGTLKHVRRFLFSSKMDAPPERDETLELFSAPNELMECVEIARRAQRLADSGIAFDRMAVLLRQPEAYQPLMEEALRRAGIPAYFEEGVARPHDAGRAFLALLRCAGEGCSAARFAEYLSLAQVPKLDDAGRPVRQRLDRVALTDEVAGSLLREEAEAEESAPGPSLQAPSRWEQLLVDAAVIGGVDRWERRLRGLEHELEARVKAAPDDTTRARIEREMRQLRVLAGYSTPLIKLLAALPGEARWGAWLGALRELAETALRDPESVVAVLEELEPMADVGPAGLEEVYSVLEDRLRTLRREPARRRYGQLFVGAIESGRGRAFDVVFVPGLAEGVFPKRSSEDPLLLDTYRAKLKAGLTVQDDRVARERLLLRTAAAAGDRLVVSFPRVDSGQNRPRVPSFYALEILRAAEGGLPDLKQFQKRASDACPLRLGWPAPRDARVAVDDQEYDLAVLDAAFRTSKRGAVGVAHYLVKSNEHLGRTMRGRWKRWESPKWAAEDGLVSTAAEVRKLLAGHRLHARPYSATTLERYAACPYRFYLHGVYGLAPRKEAVALEQMDPLTRGAIFHDLLHRIVVALRGEERLPLGRARYEDALKVADRVVDEARGGWEEQLAPAISRVWQSEWDDLKFDLRGWVRYACLVGCDWEPVESEYGFGDPPLTLFNGRLKLRGRVDLIERGADGAHRIIDLKTGKKPQNPPTFVGGGASLQPVLYSIAVEADRQVKVEAGRLFYCTHRGGYEHAEVEINGAARAIAEDVITVIDEAIEDGFLPAAPAHEACERCDYRLLCGPYEEQRVRVKSREPLKPLRWLREQP